MPTSISPLPDRPAAPVGPQRTGEERIAPWPASAIRSVADAVLHTAIYADLFDYALTSHEIHRYLTAWAAPLARHEQVSRLELGRLGPKDLVRLLQEAFHSERLAHKLGSLIALKSDGNPFFVFEILRGLKEGQLVRRIRENLPVLNL